MSRERLAELPEEHHGLSREEIAQRISFDPSEKFVVGAFVGDRLVGTAGL